MSDTAEDRQATGTSGPWLTHALFGGILAWMVHLVGMAWSVGRACATGQLWPFHVLTVVTFALAAHALWAGWRVVRADDPSARVRAAHLLGWFAIVLNVFNLVLIVVEWVPVMVIDPCLGGALT
ncbi:hypothetical protein [Salsipaludibacter albus]|uniref:hypothetical protein n=1 Tax=Salsipaludibacter albus TaxID=2849650 RepID=UPI001EE3AAD9|nr:hypothetical protein [Salsipaludibacter albus]MBY5161373.1 hypothetical protein [Salsipaludibacter albus]